MIYISLHVLYFWLSFQERKATLSEALKADYSSLEVYLDKMKDDGYYGDEAAIIALSESLPCTFVVFRTDEHGTIQSPRTYGPGVAAPTVHLLLISSLNHYVGVGTSLQ